MLFVGNFCRWPKCEETFKSVEDLIQHVEETHVPKSDTPVLNDSATIHLSYISRYFTDEELEKRRVERRLQSSQTTLKTEDKRKTELFKPAIEHSVSGFTSKGFTELDNSNTLRRSFSEEVVEILGRTARETLVPGAEKAYVCPVPGCGKRYKNANGIKYHAIHGHGAHNQVRRQKFNASLSGGPTLILFLALFGIYCAWSVRIKELLKSEAVWPYKCEVSGCGRRYKSSNGLRQHMIATHGPDIKKIARIDASPAEEEGARLPLNNGSAVPQGSEEPETSCCSSCKTSNDLQSLPIASYRNGESIANITGSSAPVNLTVETV
ncbi:juxtaposed with another zinc finger protein 1-like [Zophobas morio]|uniref:juxtaposed with another zinc finger protein 1-like n=1 Tax=Zophobas morio TaxID=2755281 RepID=UPI003082F575